MNLRSTIPHIFLLSALTAAQAQTALDRYRHNAPEFKLETAAMPAGVQQGYRLFIAKCGECHSRNRFLAKTDLSPTEWTDIVFEMQAMASSHTTETQSKAILQFVIWNDQRRKKEQ